MIWDVNANMGYALPVVLRRLASAMQVYFKIIAACRKSCIGFPSEENPACRRALDGNEGSLHGGALASPSIPNLAEPLGSDTLQVRFESPDDLRREFAKNIANRGVFVATEEPFKVRHSIIVEVILDYVDSHIPALALDGEIVHVLPPEMVSSGATPGVAVQFDASASDLRERFEPLLGEASVAGTEADVEALGRRSAKRGAVRVPIRVTPQSGPSFEATSRDLSATGILLSMKKAGLAIGDLVRIRLWQPRGTPRVDLDGKVVRQVPNKRGQIAAVVIAFDRAQAAAPVARDLIEGLREAGHRSRLGGVSGAIADLGLPNMLQVFGSSAPAGTLVVDRDGEQGWVAFAEGNLLAAELGVLSGREALKAMLTWEEGTFQFEASVEGAVRDASSGEAWPIAGALLEAVAGIDEANRDYEAENTIADFGDSRDFRLGTDRRALVIEASTTFEVDIEQEELSRDALDKADDAILDLAKAGMTVERLESIIPESPETIRAAIEGLVELGVLAPR